jgi:hypothetical protein
MWPEQRTATIEIWKQRIEEMLQQNPRPTCGQMAARLGTTKYSIAGIIKRHFKHYQNQHVISNARVLEQQKQAQAKPQLKQTYWTPSRPPLPPQCKPFPIGSLFPTSSCQWVHGEPCGAATRFCDAPSEPGFSYCAEHRMRVWEPTPKHPSLEAA